MQEKFERGSEKAQMSIDLIHEIQNHNIPEDSTKYWDKLVDDAGQYIDKYSQVDYAFAMCFMDSNILRLELKHKASKLNIGDKFEHLGRVYEVVNNHSAKFIRNIEKPKGTLHKVIIEHNGKQIECELSLSVKENANGYVVSVEEQRKRI